MLANYHMTENKYLESILNNGLIPQQGIRSNLIGDSKNAIFYSHGYQGIIAMFFMMIERFVEYSGSIGDVHIDTYSKIVEMVHSKQKQGREVNKDWPNNYYKAIMEAVKIYDVVLVQLKPEHFDYFDKNNIKYSIAYPNINNWEDIKKKCINRGNNEKFIRRLKSVFVPFYEDCLKRNYENLYIINENETLESVIIKNNIELKGSDGNG